MHRWNAEKYVTPNPNAFMPFGTGPRNCVGMRFAMEELKIALCTILKNFRFFPVEETPVTVVDFHRAIKQFIERQFVPDGITIR